MMKKYKVGDKFEGGIKIVSISTDSPDSWLYPYVITGLPGVYAVGDKFLDEKIFIERSDNE